jgi:hypothetical protein
LLFIFSPFGENGIVPPSRGSLSIHVLDSIYIPPPKGFGINFSQKIERGKASIFGGSMRKK